MTIGLYLSGCPERSPGPDHRPDYTIDDTKSPSTSFSCSFCRKWRTTPLRKPFGMNQPNADETDEALEPSQVVSAPQRIDNFSRLNSRVRNLDEQPREPRMGSSVCGQFADALRMDLLVVREVVSPLGSGWVAKMNLSCELNFPFLRNRVQNLQVVSSRPA